jgi:glycosyltransferase involved in cell wall biosynthesis
LRIVHVYKDIFPVQGGMENHIRLLCRELSRMEDLDVRILVTSPTGKSSAGRLDGVPVARAGRVATVASTPISFRLPFELRRLRPDIIHLHVPYPIGEMAAMLATPAVPTVITYHSDVVRQRTILRLYGPALKKVLRRASRILVTSEAYLDSSPWLQPVRDRCLVVPLGIDLTPFLGVRSRGDGRTLLFVGRFRYYKGLQYLIAALALLPEARLLLACRYRVLVSTIACSSYPACRTISCRTTTRRPTSSCCRRANAAKHSAWCWRKHAPRVSPV